MHADNKKEFKKYCVGPWSTAILKTAFRFGLTAND